MLNLDNLGKSNKIVYHKNTCKYGILFTVMTSVFPKKN